MFHYVQINTLHLYLSLMFNQRMFHMVLLCFTSIYFCYKKLFCTTLFVAGTLQIFVTLERVFSFCVCNQSLYSCSVPTWLT